MCTGNNSLARSCGYASLHAPAIEFLIVVRMLLLLFKLQSRCPWWFDPVPVIFMWLKNSCGVWQKRGKAIAYRVTGVSWNTIENIFSLRVSCCTFHFPNVIEHYALKICLHNAQFQRQGCHVLRTAFLGCFSAVALLDSLVWTLRYSLLLLLHVDSLVWTL